MESGKVKIWDRLAGIKKQEDTFLIAEIGKNFIQSEEDRPVDEYLKNAKQLIRAAKRSGADAVKFQTHRVEDEVVELNFTSPHFSSSDRYSWVKRNTDATPLEFWQELRKYADNLGILFFSTPMSRGAARVLTDVGVDLWKVGSGDILDFVLLDYLRNSGKPIIISSGMSTLRELDLAVNFLRERTSEVALLYCVSKYPCPAKEVRLNTITFFQNRYHIPIGFSDHSIGDRAALGAVSIDAKIVEKHFSLSRDLWGSDHQVSMTPQEFSDMSDRIRSGSLDEMLAEPYVGRKIVDALPDGDSEFRYYFRKSLVAAANIRRGDKFTNTNLLAMRPQGLLNGLPSEKYSEVIGYLASGNISKGEIILPAMVGEMVDAKV